MKLFKYFIIILLSGGLFSCELPDKVQLIGQVNSLDQNHNISRILAQYNAQTTYYGESQYNFYDRSLPDEMWQDIYRDVLLDLEEAKRLSDIDITINDGINRNQKAIIDILEVYAYHILVDLNGNVPYSDALKGRTNPTPKYDDAATIYTDLINRLTVDAEELDNAFGSGYRW